MITRRLVLNIEEEEYFSGYLIAENEVVGRHFELHIHPLLFLRGEYKYNSDWLTISLRSEDLCGESGVTTSAFEEWSGDNSYRTNSYCTVSDNILC